MPTLPPKMTTTAIGNIHCLLMGLFYWLTLVMRRGGASAYNMQQMRNPAVASSTLVRSGSHLSVS